MAKLFTGYMFVALTVDDFNLYDTIRAAEGDAVTAVHLGLSDAGLIDFSNKLGPIAAEIVGSLGNDTIIGGRNVDTVSGGDGQDALYGGRGADILNGDGGADLMAGDLGNDRYFADDRQDIIVEALDAGHDTVYVSSGKFTLGDNVENMTVVRSGRFIGHGNDLNNVIRGGSGVDQLYGDDGNDTLYGSNDDVLIGGRGDDSYYMTDATDPIIIEFANGGIDTVYSDRDINSAIANVENFVATGSDNARLTGNDLANTLIGNAFANTFFAGAGDDTMKGGASLDTFIFYDTGSVDTITDFNPADDTITLIGPAFDGMDFQGGRAVSEDEFKVTSLQNEDASDRILYNQKSGNLYYDADGLGGIDPVLFAILQHRPFLTHIDIALSF